MTRILVSVLLISMLISVDAHGQKHKQISPKYQKQFALAEQDYQNLELQKSLSRLEKILAHNPKYANAWLLKAQCEDELSWNERACESYINTFLSDSLEFHFVSLKIALLLFEKGEYYKSEEFLRRFISCKQSHEDSVISGKLSLNLNFSIDQMEQYDGDPKVYPLKGVNTDALEYFPSLTIDGKQLVFTRQDSKEEEHGGQPEQEDLYIGQLNDYAVTSIRKLPEPLNSVKNEGTQTIRQDGRLMIFTACNRPDSKGGCDLYHSVKVDSEWSKPVNIGYPVNTRYWESTPCLGPDGRSLYFASNRPGGYGGMDIWKAAYSPDSGWQDPVNLGPSINTDSDEMSPFIHGDGKSLYFSSKGWIGMGGFDIFLSRIDIDGECLLPDNLGYPLNTYSDEFGIALSGSGEYAIFSSDRDSITKRDLYRIELSLSDRPQALNYISGRVLDSLSGKAIAASVEIRNQVGELLQLVDSDPVSGEFLLGLPSRIIISFIVRHPGYLFYSEYFDLKNRQYTESQPVIISLKPIRKGDIKILQQVYFDFDSAVLQAESYGEIKQVYKMMLENPDINILITGFTDARGTEEYNYKLSRDRAEALKIALINAGIESSRLQSKGVGSSEPVSDNSS
ncbi:MAG: PD40 domain-containing protein, partial [Bacteroidales bacterium]|nr:PD40 domain-containing protein [Bacteroidales bacterium]